ncbi:MAG TPA: M50 family metallopeptidase [Candidatus Saccharimonadales bacterium]|nr:M50 family metallopeptidase [Candidatus Saccharimonadales bacterium]
MTVLLLVIGIVLFVGLVIVHELGHFWVARRNGVVAEEFGIGFPPKAWSRKVGKGKKTFVFSVNWLPIGGFVKLKGEHDSDTEPGSFGAASLWAKTKIMLAGVWVNLLVALVMLMILAWVGMPQLVANQFKVAGDSKVTASKVLVGYIETDSPASKAGLQVRDQLQAIGPAGKLQQITTAEQLPDITKQFAGKTVEVQYLRGKAQRTTTVTFRTTAEVQAGQKSGQPKGYLGISPSEYALAKATWSAPIVALGTAKQFTVLTFQGLGTALSSVFHGHPSQASEEVSGPVGIFVVLKAGSLLGYQFMLLIVAIISLTLAIMNVLPIPALDGGRLYMMLFSRLLKKPLTQKTEEAIYGGSYVFLLALIVLITISDVKKYF